MGTHFFIINPESAITIIRRKVNVENRLISYEFPLSQLNCTFVLNPNRKRFPSELYSKPLFRFDEAGNLSKIHLPFKGEGLIKEFNHFALEVFKETFFQLLSFIKTLKPIERKIASQSFFLREMENAILLKKSIPLQKIHQMIDLVYKDIVYPYLGIQRSYESKSFENVIFNYFHSLYIAYIIFELNRYRINPFQNFPIGRENYPGLAIFLFNILKTHSSMVAAETLEKFLVKSEDYRLIPLRISPTAKTIVAKSFAEKFVHNPKQIKKLKTIINIALNHAD